MIAFDQSTTLTEMVLMMLVTMRMPYPKDIIHQHPEISHLAFPILTTILIILLIIMIIP